MCALLKTIVFEYKMHTTRINAPLDFINQELVQNNKILTIITIALDRYIKSIMERAQHKTSSYVSKVRHSNIYGKD